MHRNSESESEYESQQSVQVKKTNKPKKKNSTAKVQQPKIVAKPKIVLNISDCQYPVVRNVGKKLKWKISTDSEATEWDVWWTDNAVTPQVLFKMQPHQKTNHFPGMYILSRKNLLGKGLMRMRKQFPNDYKFFPLTWMLPSQFSEFRLYYQSKPKGKARTYIVKPESMSQGKGIFLTRKIQDLQPGEHYVIQRYLHNPYLIDNLKFDFRIYVLLASVDPLRIYVYQQGLARFATETYVTPTRQNMQQVCMHLTNYAINKDSPNFIFNTNEKNMSVGHKRSLTSVYQLLQKQGVNSKQLKQKINDILIKTIIVGLPTIRHQYRSCQSQNYAANMCFQVLGFDVLLSNKAQPSLLQINYTPSFTTDTPLDQDTLILMNINPDTKQQIIAKRKQQCNRRVLTGKKPKLTQQQKQILKQQAQKIRDQYQDKNLGAFTKVYPLQDKSNMQYYSQFIESTEKYYYQSTGIRRKPVVQQKAKPIPQKAKPLLMRRGKSTNTTTATSINQKLQKTSTFKITDTCFVNKNQKNLPLINEQKPTRNHVQQKYQKAKSQIKQQIKLSSDTIKNIKQMTYRQKAIPMTQFTPTIVNNINLNFYFQPPKQQVSRKVINTNNFSTKQSY